MLMTAALSGKADAVRLLLTRGAKVDAKEQYKGQTALMWAASEGNTAAADVLLEAGADLKLKSTGGFTPLLFAVRNAHIDTAVTLLKHGANVNDVTPDGSSALSVATVNAFFELASVLLDNGANPNLSDPRASPLHTVAWLRKPGADGAAAVGNTPVGTPQQVGKVTAIQLARKLLEHGANPNTRVEWSEPRFGKEGGTARNPPNIRLGRHLLSYRGATPFYVAAKNGDVELMRLLVEFKADPKIPTLTGITPLMVAAGLDTWEGETPGPYTGTTEAERLEAVKLAVSLGNDVNARTNFGDYPMEGEVAYTLLYYPLNIDKLVDLGVGDPRWNGVTPLIGAIMSNQPSIVQYLIDQGADVNVKTPLGWTPLLVAEGVFCCNAKKEFPAAAAIIKKAMAVNSRPQGSGQGPGRQGSEVSGVRSDSYEEVIDRRVIDLQPRDVGVRAAAGSAASHLRRRRKGQRALRKTWPARQRAGLHRVDRAPHRRRPGGSPRQRNRHLLHRRRQRDVRDRRHDGRRQREHVRTRCSAPTSPAGRRIN